MKMYVSFSYNLAELFLKVRFFPDNICRENKKKHFLHSITFFPKVENLWDNLERFGRAGKATDENIILRMSFACWITKATHVHTQTHTHT